MLGKTFLASAVMGMASLVAAPAEATDFYFGFGHHRGYGHAARHHARHHDDLEHREYHRHLYHRQAHRYPMSWYDHEYLHDELDHDRYHDHLEHRGAHRYNAYGYPRYHGFWYSRPGISFWIGR